MELLSPCERQSIKLFGRKRVNADVPERAPDPNEPGDSRGNKLDRDLRWRHFIPLSEKVMILERAFPNSCPNPALRAAPVLMIA